MPPLASVLPDLAIFVAVFGVLALGVFHRSPGRRRGGRRYRPPSTHLYPHLPGSSVTPAGPSDPVSQLQAVMAGTYTAKQVLSRTEANVMVAAESAIAEAGLPWRVLAQVALGEVLASDDEAAFRAINAKRVDLLIVSDRRMPVAAIEYQGDGHWQGQAPARDAVKKEALRRAGIGYIEITPRHGPEDVRREIARLAMNACRQHAGPAHPAGVLRSIAAPSG